MFERYTENARRVVFFARFEASHYGSAYIETEHLPLGLMREDRHILRRFLQPDGATDEIRTEIEKRITPGERFPTSVEVPLTVDAKKILTLALEESDKLGHPRVGTEHLLLGMLMAEGSLAAQLLLNRGVKLETVREAMAKPSNTQAEPRPSSIALEMLNGFLAALKEFSAAELTPYFSKNAQVIDCKGKRWTTLEEIDFEALFAPYMKRNAQSILASCDLAPANSVVASVLWENVIVGGYSTRSMHRMTVVLAREAEDWAIFLIQITPVVTL